MPLLPNRLSSASVELLRLNGTFSQELLEAAEISYSQLKRWLRWAQTYPTIEMFRTNLKEDDDRFENDLAWRYVLREPLSRVVLGVASLQPWSEPHIFSIGYWVRSDFSSRGYATEAARILTESGFKYISDIERILIQMDQQNVSSAAIPRKLGYELLQETDFEPFAPGHSGRGFIWTMDQTSWSAKAT